MHVKAQCTRLPIVIGRDSSGACEVATMSGQVPYVLRGFMPLMFDRLPVTARPCPATFWLSEPYPPEPRGSVLSPCPKLRQTFFILLEPSRYVCLATPNIAGALTNPAPNLRQHRSGPPTTPLSSGSNSGRERVSTWVRNRPAAHGTGFTWRD